MIIDAKLSLVTDRGVFAVGEVVIITYKAKFVECRGLEKGYIEGRLSSIHDNYFMLDVSGIYNSKEAWIDFETIESIEKITCKERIGE